MIIKAEVFLHLSSECTPVIDDHSGPDNVSTAVYCPSNQGDLGARVVGREKEAGGRSGRRQEVGGRSKDERK